MHKSPHRPFARTRQGDIIENWTEEKDKVKKERKKEENEKGKHGKKGREKEKVRNKKTVPDLMTREKRERGGENS